MRVRSGLRDMAINLLAQVIWVALVAIGAASLGFVFGTTDLAGIVTSSVRLPTWSVTLTSLIVIAAGLVILSVTRKASAVRGREEATQANVSLFRERDKVDVNARVIRSTRFGRWPPLEVLEHRSIFRQELDTAILSEGADVRRIWNIKSLDDIARLRELLGKYRGRNNHSIRAYFGLPDHVLPEVLVVDGRGASLSFPSQRNPHDMDWTIRFRRKDLVNVVRDYFDVLWDRAERILDSGEVTASGEERLRVAETAADGSDSSQSNDEAAMT